jgi:uncharacterized protein YkwD
MIHTPRPRGTSGKRGKLRLYSGVAACFVVMTACLAVAQSTPEAERELVRLTNQDRAHEHVAPLAANESLAQAARAHVERMMREHTLSHQFRGEAGVAERIGATRLRFQASGENVAFFTDRRSAKRNAAEANEILMHSPPHRENILKRDYNAIGVAMASDGEDVWVVEDFARAFATTSNTAVKQQVEAAIKQARANSSLPPLTFREVAGLEQYSCRSSVTPSAVLHAFPNAHSVDIYTTWDTAALSSGASRRVTSPDTKSVAVAVCPVSDGNGSYRAVVLFF